MNEFQKYIISYKFINFLGFSNQFCSRFEKFTSLITFLSKLFCILFLLMEFVKALLMILSLYSDEYDVYHKLFDELTLIFRSIRTIFF